MPSYDQIFWSFGPPLYEYWESEEKKSEFYALPCNLWTLTFSKKWQGTKLVANVKPNNFYKSFWR